MSLAIAGSCLSDIMQTAFAFDQPLKLARHTGHEEFSNTEYLTRSLICSRLNFISVSRMSAGPLSVVSTSRQFTMLRNCFGMNEHDS